MFVVYYNMELNDWSSVQMWLPTSQLGHVLSPFHEILLNKSMLDNYYYYYYEDRHCSRANSPKGLD